VKWQCRGHAGLEIHVCLKFHKLFGTVPWLAGLTRQALADAKH